MTVHQFPRLTVRGPSVPLPDSKRLAAAYQLVEQAEGHLRLGGEEASGLKLIARAAVVTLGNTAGVDEAVRWLAAMSAEIGGEPESAA